MQESVQFCVLWVGKGHGNFIVLEKSWKSLGKLSLKMGRNPVWVMIPKRAVVK